MIKTISLSLENFHRVLLNVHHSTNFARVWPQRLKFHNISMVLIFCCKSSGTQHGTEQPVNVHVIVKVKPYFSKVCVAVEAKLQSHELKDTVLRFWEREREIIETYRDMEKREWLIDMWTHASKTWSSRLSVATPHSLYRLSQYMGDKKQRKRVLCSRSIF